MVRYAPEVVAAARRRYEDTDEPMPDATPDAALPMAGAIARIEALVTNELEAEERARDALRDRPRTRRQARDAASNLASLTSTLQTLQRMRAGESSVPGRCKYCDDMPEDIDEFRNELARQIELFLESREGEDFDAASESAADGGQNTGAG